MTSESTRAPTVPEESAGPSPPREVTSLRDLSSVQWRSGIAAWLGWLFDGLDMHLYTLVAAPFVAQLIHAQSTTDRRVGQIGSWIQAAFLVGWALGGGFFGRIGDKLGRSRALGLTILTYALFTGLSYFAQEWWHLLIFRFLAALGIGGEWAVGSALLSETWPSRWRPWIAATLQTGVNIGVLLACMTTYVLAGFNERVVFLVGIVPALLVFWIRKAVPEPEEWHRAKASSAHNEPRLADLFRGEVLPITVKTILICSVTLTAWWAFLFWYQQHLRNLPEIASWSAESKGKYVSTAMFLVMLSSIGGNFAAAFVARLIGYPRAISLFCVGFVFAMAGTYGVERDHVSLLWWTPLVSFFSGIFGLFTMYLPPLFPTLLRTTGAGFCYNIGRIVAACGTVLFGLVWSVGDYREALFYSGFLFIPGIFIALLMPELKHRD
jgi:MFS family permease